MNDGSTPCPLCNRLVWNTGGGLCAWCEGDLRAGCKPKNIKDSCPQLMIVLSRRFRSFSCRTVPKGPKGRKIRARAKILVERFHGKPENV